MRSVVHWVVKILFENKISLFVALFRLKEPAPGPNEWHLQYVSKRTLLACLPIVFPMPSVFPGCVLPIAMPNVFPGCVLPIAMAPILRGPLGLTYQ